MRLVYVTSIEHKYGTNIYVNKTEEGARTEIEDYVIENWDSEMPKGQLIQVSENAVEDYFNEVEEEFYFTEFCEVGE